jgi:DNA-binding GntR family transcriptional regulator
MKKTLQPIKTSSLTAQVFETLRGAIFEGQFRPGDPLREQHLARELQVSQVVVREALLQLERLGLVVRVPNTSTSVTKLSKQEIQDRLAIRIRLEELAFIEASKRMTRENFDELNQRLAVLSKAKARNAYFETAEADLEFHRYIWEQSGNSLLPQTLEQITAPLFAFISILRTSGLETLRDTVRSHERLVLVLRSSNEERIRKEVRQHIEPSYSKFLESEIEDFQVLAQKFA